MKAYDRTYFDRWYRGKLKDATDVKLRARLAIAVAEAELGRSLRSVLDIGCGEGRWKGILEDLRPNIEYTGIDPSPYVVERYGASRNILPGSLRDFDPGGERWDLVLCVDVLHYLEHDEIASGLPRIAKATGGIAYLWTIKAGDRISYGDTEELRWRAPRYYRDLAEAAGMEEVRLDCYRRRRAMLI